MMPTAIGQRTTADTHCPYCALQCAMRLTPSTADDTSVEITGRDFPTNRGGLCKKGWTAADLLDTPGRVTEPLMRNTEGDLVATDWATALDAIAGRLRESRDRFGADSVGVFGGGGLTNEKAYQLGKFARLALGTSRIDYNGRFCMASAAAAGNRAFGVDRGLPFPLTDLDDAATILMLGSNVAATMPPFIRHLAGARAAGGLVVVDPRRSQTARLTDDDGGVHVQPAPGTDLALLLGLIHIVIAEGLTDAAYIAGRTTGVPVGQLRWLARRLAERRTDGRGVYIVTGRGVEQHVDGTDTATAAINLALVLGLVGMPGSGYGTLTGQGNGQGGREHGQKCDQLPGYRKIVDPAARAHVSAVWGVDADTLPGPGLPAVELLAALGRPGGIRCLMVHGSNVVISSPDVTAVREGLAALDFLVVCDFVLNETASFADVVLPVTQWAEEEGTMTSLEGRVIRRRQSRTAPGSARSELWIMSELARRLDAPSTWSTDPATVFDELAAASAGGIADYSGLSHALLDERSPDGTERAAYWPYASGSTGTERLFTERFAHADGRARLVPVAVRDVTAGDPAPTGGALTLITGRLLEHYQSGAQTRRVAELNDAQPTARLQIHPSTAARLGIRHDSPVRVSNPRGTVHAVAEVTADIRLDTVFLPFHYADDGCANLLTRSDVDPISAMPEFKRTSVMVAAVAEENRDA